MVIGWFLYLMVVHGKHMFFFFSFPLFYSLCSVISLANIDIASELLQDMLNIVVFQKFMQHTFILYQQQ